ncbi:MAG: T9SS type A sorting domain-containing protein [Bacteroidales bacterium]|nr:T9SS type A sorting domain-containing protein [Bacteroidales bacterium]
MTSPNGSTEIRFNAPGCKNKQEVKDACHIEIEENPDKINEVNFFPNPTNSRLFIEFGSDPLNCHLFITSSSGSKILSQQIENKLTVIDLSNLLPGIYFVIVRDERALLEYKLVKTNP